MAHPNLKKMQAATARWISEGQARPDGAEALTGRREWFERQLTLMGRDQTPPAFEGLSAFDVLDAISLIDKAVLAMTQKEAA